MVLEIAQFEIKPGMDAGRRSHQCRAFLAAKPEKTKDYSGLDGFEGCLTIQTVPGVSRRHATEPSLPRGSALKPETRAEASGPPHSHP